MKWMSNFFRRKPTAEELAAREAFRLREEKFDMALKYAAYARTVDPALPPDTKSAITDEERQNAINNMGRIILKSNGFLVHDLLSLFKSLNKHPNDNIRSDVAYIATEVGMKFKETASQVRDVLEPMTTDRDADIRYFAEESIRKLVQRNHAPD